MPQVTRRKLLAGVSATSILALAGCSELTGPDPRVTDTQITQGIGDIFTGGGTIQVLVDNDGPTGGVKVTLTFLDSAGNTVGRRSRVVEVREGNSRRVDFDVNPPRGAERYRAEAEAAEGLL